MYESPRPVLVIEDSPEDFETASRALRLAGLPNPLYHFSDGDEALDYLYQRGTYADPTNSPRPSLVLLDLNLPGTDGREVLEEIKSDEHLRTIPVVVLTTSSDVRDVERCYRTGVNSYLRKPVDLPGYLKSIERLKEYWFDVVLLPAPE